MDPFFIWIETTLLSTWVRESPSVFAFPGILALHTLGLALLAGPAVAIALHILGVASDLRSQSLTRLTPVLWIGFWINASSGLILLIAYPAKALTNPLFYIKLALVAAAVVVLGRLLTALRAADFSLPAPSALRRLASASLGLWLATIFAGRFLAYTYQRLLAYAGL